MKREKAETELTGTSGAARRVPCSEASIRNAADRGELPSRRTDSGIRVFEVSDVEKFAEQWRERRERDADG
jgi:hypothetical protein